MEKYKTLVNIGNTILQGEESITAKEYQKITGRAGIYDFYFTDKGGKFVGVPRETIESEPEFYEKIQG